MFAYLFGSTARGLDRPDSDIDIAVYLDPELSHETLEISLNLSQQLSTALGLRPVEVTTLNDAPLPLRGRAVSERQTIYSRDEPLRVRFESETMRQFLDFQFHAKAMDEQFLRDTAEGRR